MPISEETIKSRQLFSKRLRNILDQRNMNQNELAKVLGVSESTIGKWTLGKAMPRTMGVIQRMADYFGVGKSYFLETTISKRDERDLNKFLDSSEIMFDGDTYKLDDEDRQKLRSALEFVFWDAKRRNKRKKD